MLCSSVKSDSSATLWTTARQGALSLGFPRQDDWSGLPFLPPGDLPNPGMELQSPVLVGRFFTSHPTGKSSLLFWVNYLNFFKLLFNNTYQKNYSLFTVPRISEIHSVVANSLRPHKVHAILQARILEWVAFPFSRGSSQPRD